MQDCCVFLNDLAARLSGYAAPEQPALSARTYFSHLLQHNRLIDDAGSAIEKVPDLADLAASPSVLRMVSSIEHVSFHPQEQHYALAAYPLYSESGILLGYALFVRPVLPLLHDESLENGLLSSVSHDLRTPLMVIKAAVTGLLQEG